MRPVASQQNSLENPLNKLLGTEAQVRLLRVLANETEEPLTASDLAGHAGLTIYGTRKALMRLLQSGFILRVGGGRRYQYEVNRNERLIKALSALFQAEKNRYEALLSAIKKELEKPVPYAHSAWIHEWPGEYGDPLVIGVLHETKPLAHYMKLLRAQLNRVERNFDLTIEANGYTKADVPSLNAEDVTLLFGIMPFPGKNTRDMDAKPLTHKEKDQYMMDLSHKLSEVIERDTSLVRRAKEHVKSMLKEAHGAATKDIEEWLDILESYSIMRLSRFLTSNSERANRLRQSNPLFAILSPDERKRLLKSLGGGR